MKFLKKLLIRLFIFILFILLVLGIIGYIYYSKALREKPLLNRTSEIINQEHYTCFNKLPKDYVNAVISVEDRRYYKHGAIDFVGIARAFFVNIKNKELQEGGSTITQQVAKNIIFSQEDTFLRKLGEFFASYDLEKNFTKEEIFALYVNTAYFGNGYYGIYDACHGYYNKEPQLLNLDEASMLAGIPNAPSVYSPTINPDLAKQRQKHVLKTMVQNGYISQEQADAINTN